MNGPRGSASRRTSAIDSHSQVEQMSSRWRTAVARSMSSSIDYKLALNVLGAVIFAALFWLTARRGATDPVCGMKVDRDTAVTKEVAVSSATGNAPSNRSSPACVLKAAIP